MIWTLAGQRIDELTERWILWELPLERCLQYYHCALRAADLWTVPPGSKRTAQNKLAEVMQLIAAEGHDYEEADDAVGGAPWDHLPRLVDEL